MNAAEAEKFLKPVRRVPIDSEEVVGYELRTTDLDPNIPQDRIFLANAIQDAIWANSKHLIAEAPDGTLTLWTLPNE